MHVYMYVYTDLCCYIIYIYTYINIELTPTKIGTALQIFEHGHILI